MSARDKATLISDLSDDAIVELLCGLLVLRGKGSVASRLHAAYFGLGSDEAHSQESADLLRDKSGAWPTPHNGGGEPVVPSNRSYLGTDSTFSAVYKNPYFRNVYGDSTD